MNTSTSRFFIPAAVALIILSLIATTINHFVYEYPGNNYFPPQALYVAITLSLMFLGFNLQFDRNNPCTLIVKEVAWYFLVMSVLALATNAVQYTPFPPIDKQIITFETALHINIKAIMTWTHSHRLIKEGLIMVYNTLPYQMCYFPLIIIALRRFDSLREYYFLLIFSAMIGFSFYYFFPTLAPASLIDSNLYNDAQRATGLKFMQIHQHIKPTTLDGGLIALPSFHVIWAWLCLYLIRQVHILFMIMLPINVLLVASCVLLGWHYPIDIIGGLMVISMSHAAFYFYKKWAFTEHSSEGAHNTIFIGTPVG